MATHTQYYNLTKPDRQENIFISDLNDNFDAIDAQMKENADAAEAAAESASIATTESPGVVKPDGSSITVDPDGTIHGANSYQLPVASASVLGGIKVGSHLNIDQNGVLSATGGANYYTITTTPNWLESVATYSDIATTYPSPSEDDCVFVEDTGRAYYYTGTEWVLVSNNVYPEYSYAETLAILEGTT